MKKKYQPLIYVWRVFLVSQGSKSLERGGVTGDPLAAQLLDQVPGELAGELFGRVEQRFDLGFPGFSRGGGFSHMPDALYQKSPAFLAGFVLAQEAGLFDFWIAAAGDDFQRYSQAYRGTQARTVVPSPG